MATTTTSAPFARMIDAPVPFQGTEAERRANQATHCYDYEGVCYDCCCKVWHVSADYPCGARVPRAQMTQDEYFAAIGRRF